MREIAVSFASDVVLAGVLTLPEDAGVADRCPALLLLGGTGGDTFDGDINPALFPASAYPPRRGLLRRIAHELAHSGIATLRCDKRGIGGSHGLVSEANYDTDLVDNVAAFRFLQAHPGVDSDRVGVAGHSAGAFNACLVCRDVPEVAAAGLLGALYASIEDLVRWNWPRIAQHWDTFGDERRAWLLANRPREVVLSYNTERVLEAAARGQDVVEISAHGQTFEYNTVRLRQDMLRPVSDEFRHVGCPALVLHGGSDLNVRVEDCLGTYRALRNAGNDAVDLVVVPFAEHSFLQVPRDPVERTWERVSLQAWSRPIAQPALTAISSWAERVLGQAR